jgi:hypothetical protein
MLSFPVFKLYNNVEPLAIPSWLLLDTLQITVYGERAGNKLEEGKTKNGTLHETSVSRSDAADVISSWSESGCKSLPARVFHRATLVTLTLASAQVVQVDLPNWPRRVELESFKMLYSFHPAIQSPVQLDNGRFNCSVDYYDAFSQHLHCNLEQECQHGEDETGM